MSRMSVARRLLRLSAVPLILIVLFVLALPVAAEKGGPTSTTVRPAGIPHRAAPTGSNSGGVAAPLAPTPVQAAPAVAESDPTLTWIDDPALIVPSTVYNFAGDAEFSSPTTFPGGAFAGTGEVRVTGNSWMTWNPNVSGIHVLFASTGSYEIRFDTPQAAVGAVVEPNNLEQYFITIKAWDAYDGYLGSYTKPIVGDAGAAFLGLLSNRYDIKRVVVSSEPNAGGFAFSNLTYGGSLVPEVLLVKDVNPWSSTANEDILNANGIPYAVMGSAGFAAADLGQYPVVIVASDQPQGFYDVLAANESKLASYVHGGGKLQFGAAAWGWNYGDASQVTLPDGVVISPRSEAYNIVTMPDHPVVAGIPSPFYGTSASHASFSALPRYASFIAFTGTTEQAPNWAPTLVEYASGKGCVLALGQPLEAAYSWGWDWGAMLPNAILHMVQDPCPRVAPRIYGWLFIDANQNGWRDAGETQGVAAQYVLLFQNGVQVRDTYTSFRTGWYEFGDLESGDYCLRLVPPAGYVLSTPAEQCIHFWAEGEQNINFGVVKEQGVIGDTVYADANGNGVQDDGEAGYANVTLALWTATDAGPGAVVDHATTDVEGHYRFLAAPGSYFVQVTDEQKVLTGLTLTAGINPAGPITIVHGQTYGDADFGYSFVCPTNRGLLSGRVWQDNDGDAVLGAGDTGLAGVEVCASPMSQFFARAAC